MDYKVIKYIRQHPSWYVILCQYPEKYQDLLEEIKQSKQKTLLDKLDKISLIINMLEMLK